MIAGNGLPMALGSVNRFFVSRFLMNDGARNVAPFYRSPTKFHRSIGPERSSLLIFIDK